MRVLLVEAVERGVGGVPLPPGSSKESMHLITTIKAAFSVLGVDDAVFMVRAGVGLDPGPRVTTTD